MKNLITLVLALFTLAGCSRDGKGTIAASGTIEGTDVTISSQVVGPVLTVRVDEGAQVRHGDTLVTIGSLEAEIQLRQAEANLASFESAYRLAAEGSRKEDVVQAQAAFATAEADYRRMKELLASQTITQRQYEDAYTRFVAAQQTYEKLRTGLRREEVDAARQKRDLAAAQVELLRKKIRDCTVVAPSAGVVTLRGVEPGEFVAVGASLVRLTYLDKVKLTIYVNETELANVRLGQDASVTIDGAPNRTFAGKVTYISPIAEFTPKNVQTKEDRTKLVYGVRIEIPNADQTLKPGMPADASISSAQASQ